MSNLKPCPFCGASAKENIQQINVYGSNVYKCTVSCTNDDCKANINFIYAPSSTFKNPESQAKAEITKAWNRRVN